MTLVLFALSRYLLVLLFCTAAYFIGRAVLQRLTFTTLAERLSLCITFGLGVLSHLILLIGLFSWLTLGGIVLGITIAVAVSVIASLRKTTPHKGTDPTARPLWLRWIIVAVFVIVAGAALFPLWFLPLYPPTEFDVTMYHLAAPKAWLQAHAVIATPFLRGPISPHSAHTLFAALLLAKDDIAAQILSLAATGLVGMGLYGWGKRIHGGGTGLLSAALWIGSPAVLALAGVASYHVLGSLFAFASIYTLATYATTGRLTWLFAAGAFVGFAQSTWPETAFFVPVFAVATGYFVIRDRRLQPLYAVAAGVLLGWGPTLARAIWYTGNPTFPLLTEFFGIGPWWTAQDVAGIAGDIHRFGIPRTFLNFLSIPYALAAKADKFQSVESFSVALSVCLPLVALRSAFDRYIRWLGAIVLFYAVCWFLFGQIMRYLLPVMPVVCLITARTISWVIEWVCSRRPALAPGLIAITTATLLAPGPLFARKEVLSRGSVPLTTERRAAYIAARIPQYRALAVANAAPAPLYALFGTNAAYYSEGPFMGDWFGPGRYSQIIDSLRNGETLYAALHRLGAKYFLVTTRDSPLPPLPNDAQFESHFEPVFGDSTAELYRIYDSARSVAHKPTNLLRNAGFDELENAWPVAWSHFGNPVVASPEGGAASGAIAVEVTDKDGLQQPVRITPGEIYELELQAKATPPGRIFRLQVNWINRDGQICDVFIRVCTATTDWQRYSCKITAPPCAEIAQVYASGQSNQFVWLDSFVFKNETTTDSVP
jgi:Dolichyl-phosphate-mannose-protein mannosyltransferase